MSEFVKEPQTFAAILYSVLFAESAVKIVSSAIVHRSLAISSQFK